MAEKRKLRHIYRDGGQARFERELSREYPSYPPERVDNIAGAIIGKETRARASCDAACRAGRRAHHHPSTGATHAEAHARGHHGG